MGRTIAGVLVGYLVIAVVVFGMFTLAFIAMGPDTAFQPGTFLPSGLWIVLSLAVSFFAAWVGGWVCATIARTPNAVMALAILIIVLGVVFAVPAISRRGEPIPPRTDAVGTMQAMQQGRPPLWVVLLTPLVGAAGVIAGGRRGGRVAPPQL